MSGGRVILINSGEPIRHSADAGCHWAADSVIAVPVQLYSNYIYIICIISIIYVLYNATKRWSPSRPNVNTNAINDRAQ